MSRLVGQVPPCLCFSTLHLGKASKAGSDLLGEMAFSSHTCSVWGSFPFLLTAVDLVDPGPW